MTHDELKKVYRQIDNLEDIADMIAIRKGATNGDIIKAFFSISRIEDARDGYFDVYGLDECKHEGVWISKEWWNSPYKGEQNEASPTGAESEVQDADCD